jgi:hypothetical protein
MSSNWDIDENSNDKLLFVYDNIIRHSEFSEVFKQSKLEQLIKQSEIDVIGWNGNDKIYAADIAFHEAGLNYGSKIETKNRVFKKLLRSYLTLLAYFPCKKYELIFASPKVHKSTEDIIKDYFNVLNKDFSEENVAFKYISNDIFRDEIFIPTIEKTKIDSDTNELFIRAVKLSNLFEMPTNKPVDTSQPEITNNHNTINNGVTNNDELSLEFIPSDEKIFKQELLKTKRAKRTWYYKDNKVTTDEWDASKFTIESNLRGNIFSNNKVRVWKDTGLRKVKFEILGKL